MVFKGYTQIGEGTLILIRDYLEIGRYTRIGFLSFFMDSDDHFTVNMENQKVARNKAPIIIGKYNWIANKTVIKKKHENSGLYYRGILQYPSFKGLYGEWRVLCVRWDSCQGDR